MRFLPCLIAFVFMITFCHAQEIVVVDAVSGDPVVNASITAEGVKSYKISDVNGSVDLSDFASDDLLVISHVAYQSMLIRKSRLLRDGSKVMLTPLSEELEEVVLSARKWAEPRQSVDQRILAVTKEEVLFSNAQTSADLLQSTGKVFVQKSQLGGGSPMIRGFATNRLLIVVDGVRMNNAIFRGGNIQNIIAIDPLSVDSAEVIFGPGSVTYGSDAIGGVMSFYTLDPKIRQRGNDLDGRALVRYSTANNERTAHAVLNYGSAKWAGVTSVTISDFNDLIMGSHGPEEYLRPEYVVRQDGVDQVVTNSNDRKQTPTGYEQLNILQKFTYQPVKDWSLKTGIIYSTTGNYDRYDRLIRYRDNEPRAAEWYYGPQEWLMINLTAEHSGNGWLYDTMRFTNAYQQFKESRHDRGFMEEWLYATEERVDAFSSNLDLEKHFSNRSRLYYGVEYVYNKVGSSGYSQNITSGAEQDIASRYPDGSRWQSLAAYANFSYQPDRRMTLRAGVRYNYLDIFSDFSENNVFYNFPFTTAKINTDALTGSAGLHWSQSRTFRGHVQFSTAFRAPNVDDVGKIFDSEPGSVVVPNPSLKPEYAYNADLGFQLNLKEKFKFDLSLYHTWLKDAMVRRDFTYQGVEQIEYNGQLSDIQAIQNAAKARVYGLEAGANWRISNTLSALGTLTYVKGEEVLDNGSTAPLRHAAPLFGRVLLEWQKSRVKLDLWTQFNGEISFDDLAVSEQGKPYLYAVDANGNPFSPSWYTLNIRGGYEVLKNTRLQVALENITDQRYRTYSSGIAAPGRNLILSVRQTF
ncbi:TonB-dependent receptor [Robertkochia marina]|uniref:TonB-dependent receptor n=1 Tax=Robertkochia marina TaxID=1227945 RepID=A0A4S3M3P3_9FLAO|nr:TonB-dependent receptor [Robertkochia marina]THD69500.1 TonB-dependent receptor [Robertkochia marina]TRZ47241.1 TonB-dependent receptor [Robertkochia marina]